MLFAGFADPTESLANLTCKSDSSEEAAGRLVRLREKRSMLLLLLKFSAALFLVKDIPRR